MIIDKKTVRLIADRHQTKDLDVIAEEIERVQVVARAIKNVNMAHEKERERYEAECEKHRKHIASLQSECPHYLVTKYGKTEDNDPYTRCDTCGKIL